MRSAEVVPIQSATGKCARAGCKGWRGKDIPPQLEQTKSATEQQQKSDYGEDRVARHKTRRKVILARINPKSQHESSERSQQEETQGPLRCARDSVHEHRDDQ